MDPSPDSRVSQASSAPIEDEPNELARFREEWKREVERRKKAAERSTDVPGHAPTAAAEEQTDEAKPHLAFNRPASRVTAGAQASGSGGSGSTEPHPAIKGGTIVSTVSQAMGNALTIYKRAVLEEQQGNLDAALRAYRQAFRLDPNVDRAYRREELLIAKLHDYTEKVPGLAPHAEVAEPSNEDSHRSVEPATKEPISALGQSSLALTQIIDSFPKDLKFEPEDENIPIIFNDLPGEIMYAIIRKMSVVTLETFARVCRKARMLTLDPVYWSELVQSIYKPPQLPTADDLHLVIKQYSSNFRRLYIEHPRVRYDGIYIAICHYTRPGMSENHWVNVNHLITYHRYLRFYPDGQVLSLLANGELNPQHVIPILKPNLRMKGFFIGNWYLTGTTLNIVNLMDASGKYEIPGHDLTTLSSELVRPSPPSGSTSQPPAPVHTTASSSQPSRSGRGGHHHGAHEHGTSSTTNSSAPAQIRYLFDMSLNLRSKPLGRWNRLDMVTYDSVNLETGDVYPVPLKHDRPFWFSKVRSYSTG